MFEGIIGLHYKGKTPKVGAFGVRVVTILPERIPSGSEVVVEGYFGRNASTFRHGERKPNRQGGASLSANRSTLTCTCYFFNRLNNLVHQTILHGLFGIEKIITVKIALDHIEWLACMFRHDII